MTEADPAGYPSGARLMLDADTRMLANGKLIGGSPTRLLKLSGPGRAAWSEIVDGPVRTTAGARLARRLTDIGALHPAPAQSGQSGQSIQSGESGQSIQSGQPTPLDVTVVVPVRDRPAGLDRCLAALGRAHQVVVVDDASRDPARIEAVCADHGARLLRRLVNGGPGAARNTALAEVSSEFVLLLDSDCVAPADLVERLSGAFADPLVGAVAPRIAPRPGSSTATRYAAMASSLDLGARAARVSPGTRVSYVPTAALLVRRAAVAAVGGFDGALRVGEDVDLVWRLDAAGWRVRYEPTVTVQHAEPETWPALLGRRFRYGTSAGPLDRRHPGRLAPVVVHSWSGLVVAAVLARRPLLALAALGGSTIALRRSLRQAEVEPRGVATEAVRAAGQTWRQLGRAATQFASPVLVAAMVTRGRRTHRLTILAFALSAPVAEWIGGRRTLGVAAYTAGRVADDIAYGAGVIAGSVGARTSGPLRVVVVHRLLRIPRAALRPISSEPGRPVAASTESSANA
jgi:mycofactocin system glycosyltransferase